ncbi:MAG: hypothetical protein ABH919_01820 [bacterium]
MVGPKKYDTVSEELKMDIQAKAREGANQIALDYEKTYGIPLETSVLCYLPENLKY